MTHVKVSKSVPEWEYSSRWLLWSFRLCASSLLKHIFKKFLTVDIDIPGVLQVVMINSNFSLNYNVNLIKVASWFEEYDDILKSPSSLIGIQLWRSNSNLQKTKKNHLQYLQHRKIIITGAETLKRTFAYNVINQHINENPKFSFTHRGYGCFDIYLGPLWSHGKTPSRKRV